MIGIRKNDGHYLVFSLDANLNVWDSGLKSSLKDRDNNTSHKEGIAIPADNYTEIKVSEFHKNISPKLVDRVKVLLGNELLNVRHTLSPPLVIDGTSYQFSMFMHKYGDISGRLNSFKKGSKMELLVGFVKALASYSKDEMNESDLNTHLKAVEEYNNRN